MARRRALHWSDGTIAIDGPIRSDACSAAALRRSLDELRDEPALRILIQSDGGAVDEGLSLYTLLRNAGKPVEVVVRFAASMAAIVAMAGSRITVHPKGVFALHDVALTPDLFELVTGCTSAFSRRATGRDMIAMGRDLRRIDETHADIIQARTGLDRGTIRGLREREAWIDAAEAVRLGFADAIA